MIVLWILAFLGVLFTGAVGGFLLAIYADEPEKQPPNPFTEIDRQYRQARQALLDGDIKRRYERRG